MRLREDEVLVEASGDGSWMPWLEVDISQSIIGKNGP